MPRKVGLTIEFLQEAIAQRLREMEAAEKRRYAGLREQYACACHARFGGDKAEYRAELDQLRAEAFEQAGVSPDAT